MRISTKTIFDLGVASLNDRTSALSRLQQQIASGRRVLTPSDDPVSAARALEITQARSRNEQFSTTNSNTAVDALSITETALNSAIQLLQDVREQAVYAGNPTLDHRNRESIATNVEARFAELLGLANTTNGNGEYLFSGYQGATRPFIEVSPGTVGYFGDDGQRSIQISPSRQIAVSDSGAEVFSRIKNGNGVFATAPLATNTGSGVIGPGNVVNSAQLTGNQYTVTFAVTATPSGNVTTYQVVNTTTAAVVIPPGTSFVPGGAINFDGLQFDISGEPANGDQFTVTPSNNQSVFDTLNSLARTLRSNAEQPVDRARYQNNLNATLSALDNAIGRLTTAQGTIGSRLKETESTQASGEDLNLQYTSAISKLTDLDYNQAISDLTLQNTYLEAAQKSFVRIQNLSLFNYLG